MIVIALSLTCWTSAPAEAPSYRWASRAGGEHFDYGTSVAVDNSGNTYLTGYFNGQFAFEEFTLEGKGESDIFVAKLDRLGKVLWIRQAGGLADDFSRSVAIDDVGNVYIAGSFQSPEVDFGGGITVKRQSDQAIFVAKYDPEGKLLWARGAGSGPGGTANAVTVDKEGNVIIVGYFFGLGVFEDLTVKNAGYVDVFVAKYDANGGLIWVRQIGGHSDDIASAVTVDEQGAIYLTGAFSEEMRVSARTRLESAGLFDVFLIKLDAEGRTVWALAEGGTMNDVAYGIQLDPAGNIVITGGFAGSESFASEYRLHAAYRKPRKKYTCAKFSGKKLWSEGGSDVFVAKYNPAGRMIWARNVGGNKKGAPEAGYGMAIDALGHIHVVGTFAGRVLFGNNVLISMGIADVFTMEMDRDGRVLWSRQVGSQYGAPNVGYGIAVDRGGNSYITGFFQGNVNFGDGVVKSYGKTDVFVAKITAAFLPPR